MPQSRRGRRIDPDVRARIEDLAGLQWTPGGIAEKLSREPGFEHRVPSKRTIEAIASPIRRQIRGDTWSFANAGPSEARLVLPVLREAIEQSGGKIVSFDVLDAEWIARIVAAAPDIPALSALLRGRAIASIERRAGPLEGAEQALSIFLAYRPWDDLGAAYVDARLRGVVPAPKLSTPFDPLFDPSTKPALNSWLIRTAVSGEAAEP
jgi:hypothetical protein